MQGTPYERVPSQTPPKSDHSFTIAAKRLVDSDTSAGPLDYDPKKNPRNYYYRALRHFLDGEYPAAIENAVHGIDSYPDESPLGNFILALSTRSQKERVRYLQLITDGQSTIVKGYDIFREAQYLLGCAHEVTGDHLKAIVSYIAAGRKGHEAAKKAVEDDITFDSSTLGFQFKAKVEPRLRFKILESLKANEVINDSDYVAGLKVLVGLQDVPEDILANAHQQIILHEETLQQKITAYNTAIVLPAVKTSEQMVELAEAFRKPLVSATYSNKVVGAVGRYIDDVKLLGIPFIKRAGLYTGYAFGWPVGIVETLTFFGGLFKFLGFIDKDCNNGRDARFKHWVYNDTPAPSGLKNEETFPNYITTTLLGGVASWIGRGTGIVLAFGLTVVAAVVCAPFYFAAKHYQMYQAAKKEVLAENTKTITVPNGAATPAAEEKINSRLHKIARSSLADKGENAKRAFDGRFTFWVHADRGPGNILPHFLSSEPSFAK